MSSKALENVSCLRYFSCKKTSPNPSAMKQGRQLIITLLAHPQEAVRCHAYTAVLDIVKVCQVMFYSWNYRHRIAQIWMKNWVRIISSCPTWLFGSCIVCSFFFTSSFFGFLVLIALLVIVLLVCFIIVLLVCFIIVLFVCFVIVLLVCFVLVLFVYFIFVLFLFLYFLFCSCTTHLFCFSTICLFWSCIIMFRICIHHEYYDAKRNVHACVCLFEMTPLMMFLGSPGCEPGDQAHVIVVTDHCLPSR